MPKKSEEIKWFFFKLAKKKKGPNLEKIGINRNFPYCNFLKSQN